LPASQSETLFAAIAALADRKLCDRCNFKRDFNSEKLNREVLTSRVDKSNIAAEYTKNTW
jgi:hypothetical protein